MKRKLPLNKCAYPAPGSYQGVPTRNTFVLKKKFFYFNEVGAAGIKDLKHFKSEQRNLIKTYTKLSYDEDSSSVSRQTAKTIPPTFSEVNRDCADETSCCQPDILLENCIHHTRARSKMNQTELREREAKFSLP